MKQVGPYSRTLLRGAIGDAVDGRSREGRFMRAYEQSLVQHVGGEPTAVQRVLISRATRLAMHIELMDRPSLQGDGITERDGRQYSAWSDLCRTLKQLGIKGAVAHQPAIGDLLGQGQAA
jgi:hypothetical protein